MTNKILRSVMVLTLAGLALSLTAWAIASAPQQGGQAAQNAGQKRKTLRDIARERDVEFEVSAEELDNEYSDLRHLAKDAEAIIIGRITDEESSFSSDDHIVTAYQLDVLRVIKDTRLNAPLMSGQEPPAPLVTPLKLVRTGGTVLVNGHRATGRLKGAERLKPGNDYLLFLWWGPNSKAYMLAGGVSGAFLIDGEQRLSPLGSMKGMLKHKGGDLQAVVDEVTANQ
jgi:hypothetical protein